MKNMPDAWQPPYRAYVTPIEAESVTVAVLGVQAPERRTARREFERLRRLLEDARGLLTQEACDVLMETGVHHALVVTYWSSRDVFDGWWDSTEVRAAVDACLTGPVGVFCERFTSPRDHFETSSATPNADWGLGQTHPWVEDPRIGYHGASRDRIEAAEDGGLPGLFDGIDTSASVDGTGRRITLRPPGNAVFIRTAQGWSGADAEQRDFFLRGPYRAYLAGVRDLQAHRQELKCLSARLLSHRSASATRPARETQAWFLSLADMESWVWHSDTHGRIIETFGRFAERFGVDIHLLLSHEVFVVPDGQAEMTYVNCKRPTGIMGVAPVPLPVPAIAGSTRKI